MGATIAAKALVILALLGAGATGIYAVANKGFGSGKQTEKTNETTAPGGAGSSAPAGAAPGTASAEGGKAGTQEGPKSAEAGQGGAPATTPSPGNPPQTGGTGVGTPAS